MDNRAIGVFDSGLGGLTAVKEMHKVMPSESIIYFGDTGRVPYGTRSKETIIKYTRQDIQFLLSKDVKAIVIACGTASSAALDTVCDEIPIPIIGVVEPACIKAEKITKTGRIGVIATQGTIKSGSYYNKLKEINPAFEVFAKACPLFVPMVENGRFKRGDIIIEMLVKEYLSELKAANIDTLILGCTHYPLLREIIEDYMGKEIQLVDPGAEAADFVKNILEPSESGTGTQYFVSDDPQSFSQYGSVFLQSDSDISASLVDITMY